ncbi:MAG: hypothetical protein A2041_11555 [Bacteroidetes bacterium GWA2_31_9b]|nr:MAG: hypothetical protein A2041_11555 [Bacteroidetes bacterium GWA2_31_9b]
MKDFSIISVSIINLLIGIRYCILIYKKEIKPALAMWVFFTLAVVMSLITYLADGNFSIWDNILNTTDIILVTTVSVFIFIFGDKSSKFNKFDLGCLIAVLIIVVFWLFSKNHLVTNLFIQIILVISYFPVISRLFKSKENTEPFSVWIGMMLAPVFALLSSKGLLATIYSVRAIICVLLLLLLMTRIEFLVKKKVEVSQNDNK